MGSATACMIDSNGVARRHRPRVRSWLFVRQLLLIIGFLVMYKWIIVAAGDDVRPQALRNTHQVIAFERHLGIFNEQRVQEFMIQKVEWLIRVFNVYYGSVHFAATLAVLTWLFFTRHETYAAWRNLLATISVISIGGYWFYPVAPPRMFDGSDIGVANLGFVDAMQRYPGIWSYKAGVAEKIANQYAAMPSLHTGWSVWCGLALFTMGRKRWIRTLGLLHPTITVLGIVITGNHFWLDAVAALFVVALALALCRVPLRRAVAQPQSLISTNN